MEDFFTWATLATMAGCSLATTIITQFIKDVPAFKQIPTQFTSYFVSLVLMFGAVYFTGNLTAAQAAIIPVNAILTSLSSNGAYVLLSHNTSADTVIKPIEQAPPTIPAIPVVQAVPVVPVVPVTQTTPIPQPVQPQTQPQPQTLQVDTIHAERIQADHIDPDESAHGHN
jgi:hypothetical protein